MNRTFTLLALALTLGLVSPALADDETGGQGTAVPTPSDFAGYLQVLEGSNKQTITLSAMTIDVTCVPDYFLYAVAVELAKVEAPSKAFLVKKIKRLAKKYKKSRGKVGILMKFNAPSGSRDFYAVEGKLTSMIGISKTGAGKARYTVVAQTGKIERRKYSVFKPTRAQMWAGRNMPPTIKVTWNCFSSEPYTLHLALTKDIDPEKVQELKVGAGGFMHITGRGITSRQIDFEKGAMGVREKIEKVSFEYPLLAPAVPPFLAALLEEADDEQNKDKKKED